jgi:hypothetical protein
MESVVARPRSALIVCSAVALGILATATITFAASKRIQAARPHVTAAARTQREPLLVPDVRGKPYVFAKGILEDAGFAWHVSTKNGFAANVVVSQSPAAGTRVVDTGSPAVVLDLERARAQAQKGTAENNSPYSGTALQLVGAPATRVPAATSEDALRARAGRVAKRGAGTSGTDRQP